MSEEKKQTAAERLAALQAERAAFAKEREAKLAEPAAELALAREESLFKADQAFAAAQDEHGPDSVARVDTAAGTIIVKKPTKILHHWYNEQDDKVKFKASTLEKYVRPCRVWPAVEKYEAIIEAVPNALYECANAVATLAGAKRPDDIAK